MERYQHNNKDLWKLKQKNKYIKDDVNNAYRVAIDYVIRFYPRWLTYQQQIAIPMTKLLGPIQMSPEFGSVVAPNDDTLYLGATIDLSTQPAILTIPPTKVTYSILTTDVYGNIFQTNIKPQTPGIYGLVGPTSNVQLPSGVTYIPIPFSVSEWIIRSDRFSPLGRDQTLEANVFRLTTHLVPLSDYLTHGSKGDASIMIPTSYYRSNVKLLADNTIRHTPIDFLFTLKKALHDPTTPPLTGSSKELSEQMDKYLTIVMIKPQSKKSVILMSVLHKGVQTAHNLIVDNYRSKMGPTKWISFFNIGKWGTAYLDRASTSEFLQYGNARDTAVYYHVFNDSKGHLLDCSYTPAYILTFPHGHIPEAKRFWSVTAYLAGSITLVPNKINKYLVASYTPGLTKNKNGSLSIHIQPEKPPNIPIANWLPCPRGQFNLMLRVYGPEGSVANDTYIPPAIKALSV